MNSFEPAIYSYFGKEKELLTRNFALGETRELEIPSSGGDYAIISPSFELIFQQDLLHAVEICPDDSSGMLAGIPYIGDQPVFLGSFLSDLKAGNYAWEIDTKLTGFEYIIVISNNVRFDFFIDDHSVSLEFIRPQRPA